MSIEPLFGPGETDSEADDEDENDVPSERDSDSDYEDGQPRTSPAGSDHDPQPPTNENNAEEDGHMNAENVDYRQPRPPFVGCYWSGVKNAFIRTDELNTTRPRGSTPGLHLGGEYQWIPPYSRADARRRDPSDRSTGSTTAASRNKHGDAVRPERDEQLAP